MTGDARLFRSLLRTDFMVFVERCFATLNPGARFQDSWHLQAIAEALRRVDVGEIRRLIVNVPPRSGKSILISIAYPAWRLGHDPRTRIICVSSDDKLVLSLAASFRAVVESVWYRRAFPNFSVKRGGNRATETVTTVRGYRYGVSLGGSVLGRGADLIIADDAMSPEAALSEAVRRRELEMWTTKFPSRLDDKAKGAIVIVGQRLHQHDLVGFLAEDEDEE
ncbi:hypothetical protein [Enterovirga sp. CN4-39]|uniref:hypothetical protein n=1 Tax=Enterovirga sp. CN4-39 TaxID=3400910 RepID=UPI003BFB3191